MPNWCENKTTIRGSREAIAEIVRGMTVTDGDEDTNFRIANLMPMPEELSGTTSPTPTETFDPDGELRAYVDDPTNEWWTEELYEERRIQNDERRKIAEAAFATTGFYSWWDWQLSNWGIKWGDSSTEITVLDDGKEIEITYETPWGPFVDTFWNEISERYNVSIITLFSEPGMMFYGATAFTNGKEVAHYDADMEVLFHEASEKVSEDLQAFELMYDSMNEHLDEMWGKCWNSIAETTTS